MMLKLDGVFLMVLEFVVLCLIQFVLMMLVCMTLMFRLNRRVDFIMIRLLIMMKAMLRFGIDLI